MSHLNFSCVQIVSDLVDHTLRQRGVHLHNVRRKFDEKFSIGTSSNNTRTNFSLH